MPHRFAIFVNALFAGWSVLVPYGSPGPFSPCGAPQAGTGPARVEGYTSGSPFDRQSVVATVLALALLLAVAGVITLRWRRSPHGRRNILWLAGGSLLAAGLMAAWIWRLRTSYLGGCAITFNASPFSQTQAPRLASTFVVIIAALALAWAVVAARSARRLA